MEHSLFAYGTLMDEDIMHRVVGIRLRGEQAKIHGFQRHAFIAEPYPAVVASASQSVTGVLYRDVPSVAWRRLDRFEGAMYRRQTHCLSEPIALSVDLYVLDPEYIHLLAQRDWDFQKFLREHKNAYLER